MEKDGHGKYRAKHKSYTHENQYVYVTYSVLAALADFVEFVFQNADEEKQAILDLFKSTEEEITKVNKEVVGSDFDAVE